MIMIHKFHHQFVHLSTKNLKAIIKNADALSENKLIEDISKKSEIYYRFKKTPA